MVFKTPLKKLERNRRWRKNNPEKFKLAKETWKQNNLERYRELQRKWEEKNRPKKNRPKKKVNIKEYKKDYYQKNKKGHRILTKKWAQKNKDKINEYKRKRDVKKRNVKEEFTKEEWRKKLLETKGICPKCKKYIGINNLTIDHSPPISKVPNGFIYYIKNVSPLCRSCNSVKGAKY